MRRSIRFSPWPILFTLMAIAMAVGVFAVTQRVQHREAHVAEMNRQLLTEQQAMRVLDAEWAYLTRPQRLEELVTMKDAAAEDMPPAPTPIATVVEETPAHVEAVKVETVAAIEPAAAEAAAIAAVVDDVAPPTVKPVTLTEDASVKEVTPPEQAPVKAASVKKAEVKKTTVKKTAAAKTAPKTKTATAKTKAAPVDDVWRITPKVRTQQQRPQQVVSYKPRAGVARPILE